MKQLKKQKGFALVELLIIITIIALIAGAGWLFVARRNSVSNNAPAAQKSEQTNPTPSTATTEELSPQTVIQAINSNFKSKYALLNMDENNQPKQGEMSVRTEKNGPTYKMKGSVYYIKADSGASIDLMPGPTDSGQVPLPRKSDTNVRSEVVSILNGFGLVKTMSLGQPENGTGIVIYEGKGIICSVDAADSATSSNSVMCGSVQDYIKAAATIAPFAKVVPGVTTSTVFTMPRITGSQVDGYERATMGMGDIDGGGSATLLYRKTGGAWMYFKNTQSVMPCAEYNTQDIRNSYMGEVCMDANNNQSKVK